MHPRMEALRRIAHNESAPSRVSGRAEGPAAASITIFILLRPDLVEGCIFVREPAVQARDAADASWAMVSPSGIRAKGDPVLEFSFRGTGDAVDVIHQVANREANTGY